jgi:hypothetical protein
MKDDLRTQDGPLSLHRGMKPRRARFNFFEDTPGVFASHSGPKEKLIRAAAPPLAVPSGRVERRLTDRRNNQQNRAALLKPSGVELPTDWWHRTTTMNDEHDQFSDILTDMCGAIVKTIGLIPPEQREARLLACAYVLDHINDAVERMVNGGNATEH